MEGHCTQVRSNECVALRAFRVTAIFFKDRRLRRGWEGR